MLLPLLPAFLTSAALFARPALFLTPLSPKMTQHKLLVSHGLRRAGPQRSTLPRSARDDRVTEVASRAFTMRCAVLRILQ